MLRKILIFFFSMTASVAAQDDFVKIRPPVGFIESSTVMPSLKDKALLGRPKNTQLVGVYLLPDELAAITRGEEKRMSIFCRAYVANRYATEKDSIAAFRTLVVNAQREADQFNIENPATRRIIDRYVEATEQRLGQRASIEGVAILGSILNTSNAYGSSMIVSTTSETAQGEVSVPMVATVAWVRQGNLTLEMSSIAQFTGEPSILLAQEILIRWVNAVLAAPQTP